MDIEKLFHEWRNSVDEAAKAKAKANVIYLTEYLELLLGLKSAVETYESLRNRMIIAQERIGIYRTHEANKRKEFSNYGN